MNNVIKLGATGAAIVLVGLAAVILLPDTVPTSVALSPAGPSPSSRPSPSSSPGPIPTTSPGPGASVASGALPVGALAAGRYHIDVKLLKEEADGDGRRVVGGVARVTFDLPGGWSGLGDGAVGPGRAILKGDPNSPAGVAMAPSAVDLFYFDPCHSGFGAEVHRDWARLMSSDEFSPAAMLDLNSDRGIGRLWGNWADETSLPPHKGFAPTSPTATKPSKGTIAGLDGWYIAARTPTDLDITACDGAKYALWVEPDGGHHYAHGPGQLDRLWIVGVNGSDSQPRITPLVIDAASQAGASPADLAELQAIIDSVKIELVEGALTQSAAGRLAYERGGDVYLADPDGGNPVRVAPDGPGDGAGGPDFALVAGSIWAPDGRHFMYLEGGAQSSAHIGDAEGRLVASFANVPGFSGYPVWSPDSMRLQAWTDLDGATNFTRISIYGIDGQRQAVLPLPDGYTRFRENLGVWAPDGRSVWALIESGGDREVWELPIDGSAPRRIVEGIGLSNSDLSFARDGGSLAFSDRSGLLNVANADGTGIRPAVRGGDTDGGQGMVPVWSPDGRQLAYFTWLPGDENNVDLKVVDVATGIARTLVADVNYAAWPPYSWSRDGNRILFSRDGGPGDRGLWAVGTAGGDATLLVAVATTGEWQPAPAGE